MILKATTGFSIECTRKIKLTILEKCGIDNNNWDWYEIYGP